MDVHMEDAGDASPHSISRFGRTRKPKISTDFCDIEEAIQGTRVAKKQAHKSVPVKPTTFKTPVKYSTITRMNTSVIPKTSEHVTSISYNTLTKQITPLKSKLVPVIKKIKLPDTKIVNRKFFKAKPNNEEDDDPDLNVSKVLKIVSTKKVDTDLVKGDAVKSPVKKYCNKKRNHESATVESFGLPDQSIVPIISRVKPKRIHALDVQEENNQDVTLDSSMYSFPWEENNIIEGGEHTEAKFLIGKTIIKKISQPNLQKSKLSPKYPKLQPIIRKIPNKTIANKKNSKQGRIHKAKYTSKTSHYSSSSDSPTKKQKVQILQDIIVRKKDDDEVLFEADSTFDSETLTEEYIQTLDDILGEQQILNIENVDSLPFDEPIQFIIQTEDDASELLQTYQPESIDNEPFIFSDEQLDADVEVQEEIVTDAFLEDIGNMEEIQSEVSIETDYIEEPEEECSIVLQCAEENEEGEGAMNYLIKDEKTGKVENVNLHHAIVLDNNSICIIGDITDNPESSQFEISSTCDIANEEPIEETSENEDNNILTNEEIAALENEILSPVTMQNKISAQMLVTQEIFTNETLSETTKKRGRKSRKYRNIGVQKEDHKDINIDSLIVPTVVEEIKPAKKRGRKPSPKKQPKADIASDIKEDVHGGRNVPIVDELGEGIVSNIGEVTKKRGRKSTNKEVEKSVEKFYERENEILEKQNKDIHKHETNFKLNSKKCAKTISKMQHCSVHLTRMSLETLSDRSVIDSTGSNTEIAISEGNIADCKETKVVLKKLRNHKVVEKNRKHGINSDKKEDKLHNEYDNKMEYKNIVPIKTEAEINAAQETIDLISKSIEVENQNQKANEEIKDINSDNKVIPKQIEKEAIDVESPNRVLRSNKTEEVIQDSKKNKIAAKTPQVDTESSLHPTEKLIKKVHRPALSEKLHSRKLRSNPGEETTDKTESFSTVGFYNKHAEELTTPSNLRSTLGANVIVERLHEDMVSNDEQTTNKIYSIWNTETKTEALELPTRNLRSTIVFESSKKVNSKIEDEIKTPERKLRSNLNSTHDAESKEGKHSSTKKLVIKNSEIQAGALNIVEEPHKSTSIEYEIKCIPRIKSLSKEESVMNSKEIENKLQEQENATSSVSQEFKTPRKLRSNAEQETNEGSEIIDIKPNIIAPNKVGVSKITIEEKIDRKLRSISAGEEDNNMNNIKEHSAATNSKPKKTVEEKKVSRKLRSTSATGSILIAQEATKVEDKKHNTRLNAYEETSAVNEAAVIGNLKEAKTPSRKLRSNTKEETSVLEIDEKTTRLTSDLTEYNEASKVQDVIETSSSESSSNLIVENVVSKIENLPPAEFLSIPVEEAKTPIQKLQSIANEESIVAINIPNIEEGTSSTNEESCSKIEISKIQQPQLKNEIEEIIDISKCVKTETKSNDMKTEKVEEKSGNEEEKKLQEKTNIFEMDINTNIIDKNTNRVIENQFNSNSEIDATNKMNLTTGKKLSCVEDIIRNPDVQVCKNADEFNELIDEPKDVSQVESYVGRNKGITQEELSSKIEEIMNKARKLHFEAKRRNVIKNKFEEVTLIEKLDNVKEQIGTPKVPPILDEQVKTTELKGEEKTDKGNEDLDSSIMEEVEFSFGGDIEPLFKLSTPNKKMKEEPKKVSPSKKFKNKEKITYTRKSRSKQPEEEEKVKMIPSVVASKNENKFTLSVDEKKKTYEESTRNLKKCRERKKTFDKSPSKIYSSKKNVPEDRKNTPQKEDIYIKTRRTAKQSDVSIAGLKRKHEVIETPKKIEDFSKSKLFLSEDDDELSNEQMNKKSKVNTKLKANNSLNIFDEPTKKMRLSPIKTKTIDPKPAMSLRTRNVISIYYEEESNDEDEDANKVEEEISFMQGSFKKEEVGKAMKTYSRKSKKKEAEKVKSPIISEINVKHKLNDELGDISDDVELIKQSLEPEVVVIDDADYEDVKVKLERPDSQPNFVENDFHKGKFDMNAINDYFDGDLAYAKLGMYPYWPCLITMEPKSKLYRKKLTTGDKSWIYHVRFFGDRGRRSWVRAKLLLPLNGMNDLDNIVTSLKKQGITGHSVNKYMVRQKSKERWLDGMKEAVSLLRSSATERYDFFFQMFASNREKKARLKQSEKEVAIKKEPKDDVKPDVKKIKISLHMMKEDPDELPLNKLLSRTDLISETSDSDSSSRWSIQTPTVLTADTQSRLYKFNNLFKRLIKDRVCHVCYKYNSAVIRCIGKCNGYYHKECACEEVKQLRLNLSLEEQIDMKLREVMAPLIETTDYSYCVSDYSSSDESVIDHSDIIQHVTADDVIVSKKSRKMNKNLHKVRTKREVFRCDRCVTDEEPDCFVCGKTVSPSNSKIRQICSIMKCGKFYHNDCLKLWPQTQINFVSKTNLKTPEFDAFTCPRHVCHICVSDNPRGGSTRITGDKLVRCLKCPATYHASTFCIPAGTTILSQMQIICPRHIGYDENRTLKLTPINTTWCFICSEGGDLICCDTCPASVHQSCSKLCPAGNNTYICEECESGRLPLYDEIVWVKLGTNRWWPALILFPNEVPPDMKCKPHRKGEFIVKFFGTHDHYWVSRGRVFLFQEGDHGPSLASRKKNKRDKRDAVFKQAVEEAANAHKFKMEYKQKKVDDIASRSNKPPHYFKLKFNKPVGNVRVFDGNTSTTAPCNCDPHSNNPCGPDSYCVNRLLMTECDPDVCPARSKCQNQSFEKREYPSLIPYKTKARGWGLKTLEAIKKGQFVIEYVGEVIDEQEYQRRMAKMHELKDDNYYFLQMDNERMIDAGPKGNMARFMNHCCDPNCETQKWTVKGDIRVGLFAKTNIPADTEVTFNYNLECVGEEKKVCWCGAKTCSGFIGEKARIIPEEKKTKKLTTKLRKKRPQAPSVPAVVKEPCFICGSVEGSTISCSNKLCTKYYHLTCINLDAVPEGQWSCPWHYCSICTKRTIRCCVECVKSYCPSHSEGHIRHDRRIGYICIDHDPTQEVVKNIVNTADEPQSEPKEWHVTSTTSEGTSDSSSKRKKKETTKKRGNKQNKVDSDDDDIVLSSLTNI